MTGRHRGLLNKLGLVGILAGFIGTSDLIAGSSSDFHLSEHAKQMLLFEKNPELRKRYEMAAVLFEGQEERDDESLQEKRDAQLKKLLEEQNRLLAQRNSQVQQQNQNNTWTFSTFATKSELKDYNNDGMLTPNEIPQNTTIFNWGEDVHLWLSFKNLEGRTGELKILDSKGNRIDRNLNPFKSRGYQDYICYNIPSDNLKSGTYFVNATLDGGSEIGLKFFVNENPEVIRQKEEARKQELLNKGIVENKNGDMIFTVAQRFDKNSNGQFDPEDYIDPRKIFFDDEKIYPGCKIKNLESRGIECNFALYKQTKVANGSVTKELKAKSLIKIPANNEYLVSIELNDKTAGDYLTEVEYPDGQVLRQTFQIIARKPVVVNRTEDKYEDKIIISSEVNDVDGNGEYSIEEFKLGKKVFLVGEDIYFGSLSHNLDPNNSQKYVQSIYEITKLKDGGEKRKLLQGLTNVLESSSKKFSYSKMETVVARNYLVEVESEGGQIMRDKFYVVTPEQMARIKEKVKERKNKAK